MKDEGIGATLGCIILGAVVTGIVWTLITGQVAHLIAIGLAVWALGRVGRGISR